MFLTGTQFVTIRNYAIIALKNPISDDYGLLMFL